MRRAIMIQGTAAQLDVKGLAGSLLALCLVIGLGPSAEARLLTDMAGRQVELQEPPGRIVSLAPSLTEILFALGAGDAVVGVTDYADYPPEVRKKVSVGGGLDPNLEVIVALRPDLVLASADTNRWDALLQLERLKIPVFGVRPAGLEGVLTSIQKVGEVVGRLGQAEALIATMRRRMAVVSEKVRGLARPQVLYVVWVDPLVVAGRGTVIDDLIRVAGGRNTVRAPGFPRYGLEEIFAHPPDLILLASDRGGRKDWKLLRRLPAWREMRAVREGAVRAIDATVVNRPGPRIAEAVELLAHLLHPEAFSEESP
ncbi:MAG: ABC transporter substrate-binding protein [Candidatus Methylomirabilales bacterium]